MKFKLLVAVTALALFAACTNKPAEKLPAEVSMAKDSLLDKIKGGWAGQAIGCTFGGPTEFRFNGTMIQEYTPIPFDENSMKWWYDNAPGLYDDVYMDLTFVDVFERCGLDAPVDSFANQYANADYWLWHANQAGRYNLLNGIKAPESGHWLNNPHADDLDYQIEADYAGLMAPGMPNTANEISDKIGHIMNYGDGWYGGVYVGAMYSLAFVSNNVEFVVTEALKSIPPQSDFYKCMADVIAAYKKNPNDWKEAWFTVEKNWSSDIGCPDGVFVPFNIDAKVNSAYIIIGLLYGKGDFDKTLDIATRCGQDSDCNPASAGGILGTMIGYSSIPEKWLKACRVVEDIDFKYTTVSLNKVYQLSYKHALALIEKNGGKTDANTVSIKTQQIVPVRYEKAFEGHTPIELRQNIWKNVTNGEYTFEFEGNGFVIKGESKDKRPEAQRDNNLAATGELYIDGQKVETATLPVSFKNRRHELFWKYQLTQGKHTVTIKTTVTDPNNEVWVSHILVYAAK